MAPGAGHFSKSNVINSYIIKKGQSPDLKLDAVQRVLAGESVKIVAKHLGVTDPDYIYNFDLHSNPLIKSI
jgi:hypothetical protein